MPRAIVRRAPLSVLRDGGRRLPSERGDPAHRFHASCERRWCCKSRGRLGEGDPGLCQRLHHRRDRAEIRTTVDHVKFDDDHGSGIDLDRHHHELLDDLQPDLHHRLLEPRGRRSASLHAVPPIRPVPSPPPPSASAPRVPTAARQVSVGSAAAPPLPVVPQMDKPARRRSGGRPAVTVRSMIIVAVSVAVLAGGGASAWALTNGTGSDYRTATAELGNVADTLATTGTLQSTTSAQLDFQVSGQVASVSVAVGQQVSEGEVLAALDTSALAASVTAAESSETSTAGESFRNGRGVGDPSAASSSTPRTTTPSSTKSSETAQTDSAAISTAQAALTSDQKTTDADSTQAKSDLSNASSVCADTTSTAAPSSGGGNSSTTTTSTTAVSTSDHRWFGSLDHHVVHECPTAGARRPNCEWDTTSRLSPRTRHSSPSS